jgi:hypothetical protein
VLGRVDFVSLGTDMAAGVFDLLLASEQEQDVTLALAGVDLHGCAYDAHKEVALGLGREEDLDGEGAYGNTDERRVAEELLELE